MTTRFAFTGFRHGHINALYRICGERDDIEIVASCEEDRETREGLQSGGAVEVTHDDCGTMLAEVDCDAVAVGEYYEKRGRVVIQALRAGKHAIADKPLCTRLSELDEIESLSAANGLSVGCMLDLRNTRQFATLRELVLAGEIGEVHAISFNGQHPLSYASRPHWYFEEGKHGGTLNDLAIHAIDYIPWATGLKFTQVSAARNWNACLKEVPFFKDSAQVMMTMDNGCGVLGDVSYLTPDSFGYRLPQYWRMTFWGQDGVLETSVGTDGVLAYRNGEKEAQCVPLGEVTPPIYFESFLSELRGESASIELPTATVIESSRNTLRAQQAADEGLCNVAL